MDSTLQIIIAAKDQATAALGKIQTQLDLLAASAKEAAGQTDAALGTIDASMDGAAASTTAAMTKSRAQMDETMAKTEEMQLSTSTRLAMMNASYEESSAKMQSLIGVAALVGVAAATYIGVKSVQAAGDFQQQLTKLTTTAGESQANLGLVGDGIQKISVDTGTGVKQLGDAMYIVESAGQHGADGLNILKAAAQGAKAENSDLTTVADAVTSVLRDYNKPASDAASVTSKLVAAVGAGKTNFNDFTGALHSVLPIAASAHISLDDIAGSMASMTVHGTTAQQAAENMADAIRHLQSPTQPMITELAQLGLTSNDVSDSLAKKGLSGTMEMLSTTILNQMGPAGKVLLNTMNTSKDAARDANDMIKAMPASLQSLAKGYQTGQISVNDYRKDLKALPTDQAVLMNQFKSLSDRANGFSNAIKAGGPDAQTYASALQKATGDASSLNVALQLTGENSAYTSSAIKAVTNATAEAGDNVKGWSEIQGNMNFKMSQAKEAISNTGLAIGTALLPTVTALLKGIDSILVPIAEWAENHRKLATVIMLGAVALGAALAVFILVPKAIKAIEVATIGWEEAMGSLSDIMDTMPWVLALTAIAVVAVLVMTHWQEVKKFFEDFATDIPKLFDRLVGDVKFYFNKLVDDVTGIISKWGKDFEKDWDDIWDKFHTPIEVAAGVLLLVFGPALVRTAAQAAVSGAEIATQFAGKVLSSVRDMVGNGASAVKDFAGNIKDLGKSAVETGKSIGSSMVSGAKTVASSVASAARGLVSAAGAAYSYAAAGWAAATAWIAANIPIILTGVAIAALIIIIIEIVKHWQTVKQWGEDAWNGIKTAWSAAGSFFSGVWKDIVKVFSMYVNFIVDFYKDEWRGMVLIWNVLGTFFTDLLNGLKKAIAVYVGLIVDFFKLEWNGVVVIWNGITGFFTGLWNGIRTVIHALGGFIADFFRDEWNGLVNIWNGVSGFFSGLWNGLKGAMGVVGGIISAPFKDAFNAVARFWNDSIGKLSFNVPNWVPGIGGKGFSMPKLPYLQSGTPYFGGGPVIVGELGPEVVNLPQGSQVYSNANSQGMGGQPLVGTMNITIQSQAFMGNTTQAQQFATQIYQQLQQVARRHGQAAALPNIGILPS